MKTVAAVCSKKTNRNDTENIVKKKMKWSEFETLFGRKEARPDDSLSICGDEYSIEGADAEGPTFAPEELVEVVDEDE
ncbi:MAG: hypothetical protein ABIK09_17480 [Pseudomonadota bacterium]